MNQAKEPGWWHGLPLTVAILTPHRRFLATLLAIPGAAALGGCDRFAGTDVGRVSRMPAGR